MRYKEITSPFIYYFGVIVGIGALVATSIIFCTTFINANEPAYLVSSLFIMIIFWLTYERSFKYIYAKINLEKKTLVYGNILFSQETELDAVKFVKTGILKRIFEKTTYKVQIGHHSYLIHYSSSEDLEKYLFELKNGSMKK